MTEGKFDVVVIGPYPEDPAFIKNGTQAAVYGLSRALRAESETGRITGISIPLAAGRGKVVRQAPIGGIEVTYLTAPHRFLASSLIHLRRAMRLINALNRPIVHVHGTGPFQTVICMWLRFKGIPFVWTLHGITEKETYQRYRRQRTPGNAARYSYHALMERTILKTAPDIFVDTPYVKHEIKTRSRVHVLPAGVFTQEFSALSERARIAPVVISIGVIDPRKGHHHTLKAFAKVKAAVPAAKLIIAGSLTEPPYLDALKALAAKLEIGDAVEFAVDCPRSEIMAKLGQARVFTLHSQEESQGIALCEALAAGLPIVATRVGGIPFVVTEAQDGFLTPYGDITSFADAITRLLTDDELCARMSRQAIQSSARFDWKNIIPEVIKIYRQASVRFD